MQMMRLVVQNDEIRHLTNDDPKINGGISCLSAWTLAQEIIRRVRVFEARRGCAFKDPMNVGQEQVALRRDQTDVVLDVDRELKVVLPVLTVIAVVRQNRIFKEDTGAVEIDAQPIEHDDIR